MSIQSELDDVIEVMDGQLPILFNVSLDMGSNLFDYEI